MKAFRPKILVVDDDEQMLNLLRELLGGLGVEVRCLQSSREAAELINREKFDGFFLDWLMPELDGLQLAERIRWSKTNSTCPMIILTANQEPDAMRKCFRVGVNFFLQKPATVEQIQNLIRAARDLMLQERLRYQRVPLSAPVRCQWQLQTYEQRALGETVNLSTSGMLARLDTEPPAGALVQLSFSLPGEKERFASSACVVRRAPGGHVGLRFVNLSQEDRWRLMAFSKAALSDTGVAVS